MKSKWSLITASSVGLLLALLAFGETQLADRVDTVEVKGVECERTQEEDGTVRVSLRDLPVPMMVARFDAYGEKEVRCLEGQEAIEAFCAEVPAESDCQSEVVK